MGRISFTIPRTIWKLKIMRIKSKNKVFVLQVKNIDREDRNSHNSEIFLSFFLAQNDDDHHQRQP